MSRLETVLEITDEEIKILWFSPSFLPKQGRDSTQVKIDRILLPSGVCEQGILRQDLILTGLVQDYFAQKVKQKGKKIPAHVAVSERLGFMRCFALPWISKRERKQAIRYLVEAEVPIPFADLAYDFLVLAENRSLNKLEVLVGAVRKSIVQRYVESLSQAGLEIKGVGFAAADFGEALGLNSGEDILYLEARGKVMNLMLFRGAIPEIVRTFSLAQFAGYPEGEGLSEMHRILMYYGAQHPDLVIRRILRNGGPPVAQVSDGLLNLGIANSCEQISLKGLPITWQEKMSGADDCAVLLGFGYKIFSQGIKLNFWPDYVEERWFRLAVKSVLALFIFFVGLGIFLWYPLHVQERRLASEIAQYADRGAKTEALLHNNQELMANWNKVLFHPFQAGESLAQVQKMVAPGVVIKNLEYKDGALFVRGTATGVEDIEKIIFDLRSSGWNRPYLTSYQFTKDNISFSLTATGK